MLDPEAITPSDLARPDQSAYPGPVAVQVNVYEAKTRLSQLLDQAASGDEVVIARNGRPVARLVAVSTRSGHRRGGAWRGKGWVAPDFDETPQELIDLFYGAVVGDGSDEPQ